MPDDQAGAAATLSPGCGTGDPLWDDWDTPPRVPPTPVLHLDGFDGPLDLLLDLAERQRFDLGRISIVALVDQFVAASVRAAAYVPIERQADWLVMATRLVLLRSRLLWPATPALAAEAARDAEREIGALDELRFIRTAAAWLQARPQLGFDVFARGQAGPDPHEASYMTLMEACLSVLRGRDDDRADGEATVYRPPVAAVFRIPDALLRVRGLVAALTEARPLSAFLPRLSEAARERPTVVRSAVASTLVAALELCRNAVVELDQTDAFGEIVVSRRAPAADHQPDARPD
jgi:segregation and condensation protein A